MQKMLRGDRVSGFSRLTTRIQVRRQARRARWGRLFRVIRHFRRSVALFLLLVYLAILGHLTLFRFHQLNPGYNLVPGRTILHDLGHGGIELVVNTLGNLVATIPLGILLPIALPRWMESWFRVVIVSFLTSLLIEITQRWMGQRVADVDDLILNTLGGWFGYGVSLAARWWLKWRDEADGSIASPAPASVTARRGHL